MWLIASASAGASRSVGMNILENRIVSSSKGRRIEIMLPDRLSLILCEGAESSALPYL
jgi:hypothetical protein